jgi:hypothetical protein
MAELQSKVAPNVNELGKFQVISQEFKQYIDDLRPK